ncbi:hypothetical protein DFJ74DRAFT_205967 [Hyaloraphidium curvatum]|nr:hypothetical protein DFJ74DRAFT_205967 [Hyaloraphidium curvatum]
MSSRGIYGTASDTVRRTWNKADVQKRARERDEAADDDDREKEERRKSGKKHKRKDRDDKEEPVMLAGRTEKIDLESNLGKTQVVQAAGDTSKQPGFYCKVCDMVVRDSVNYLDHINGRKHQRNMGLSMQVERSTADQVRAKLELLKRKQEQGKKEYDFDARIAELQEKDELEKQRQREKKKRKKSGRARSPGSRGSEDESEENGTSGAPGGAVEEHGDDEMARIMGFGGFVAKG